MNRTVHRIFISVQVVIVLAALILLVRTGYQYYRIPLDQRFFDPRNPELKPSGYLGHGYGIAGTLMILTGIITYMVRKRVRRLSRLGYLKHWLEFHIFLCVLGPVFILFHTAFKFGGIVAVSFWSMTAVVLSGVIGRFIYIQIPRSVEGRELSLSELCKIKNEMDTGLSGSVEMKGAVSEILRSAFVDRPDISGNKLIRNLITGYRYDRRVYQDIRRRLRTLHLKGPEMRRILKMVKSEIAINRKIDRLMTMQKIMQYWHVLHLPFALTMLIIMVIHVVVVITLGYKWIF